MSTSPDLAVVLVRLELKLDQLLTTASDHETRLRDVENSTKSGKALAITIANAVLTLITSAMAGTTVIGG